MSPGPDALLAATLTRYWGFDTLRPLQAEAVAAAMARRDSLVVLPTGGGKSLCYQLPPLLRGPGESSLCVVVSPLIALMKDQVDGLRLAGYPAAALHGAVSAEEAGDARRGVEQGRIKLLFVSPERLLSEGFLGWLAGLGRHLPERGVAAVAIDEAHCISQWGHDFRPEYRRLAEMREVLPGVPMHAYTATATPRVREDIVHQLRMVDAAVHVGTFDRPNLTYRVLPRVGQGEEQIEAILRRHAGEAAIVYCISRKQTESVADALTARGIGAAAYHAGLQPALRARVQEDFLSERLDVVVATVAFGMGIDRGDVRAVVHASMPKSVEAYQQETGRAGRDGLPSECVLLYASSDAVRWGQLMDRSSAESEVDVPPAVLQAQKDLLHQMQRVASGTRCRHRALSEYFGQAYVPPDGGTGCNACDVCNSELEDVEDSTTIARKILSCVARLRGTRAGSDGRGDAFGAAYLADVLRGSSQARILQRGHEKLSTWGLLRDVDKDTIVSFVDQLVDLGALTRDGGEFPVLRLEAPSGPILKGEVPVHLLRARAPEVLAQSDRKRRKVDGSVAAQLSPDEHRLFEALRQLRRGLATERGVPPYVVFGDAPLIEMARVRPGTLSALATIKGVGQNKLEQFGDRFLASITEWCAANAVPLGTGGGSRPAARVAAEGSDRVERAPSEGRRHAFTLFAAGVGLEEICAVVGRARSTTLQYLVEWIEQESPATVAPWVDDADYARIAAIADSFGDGRMKPIFDHFDGTVPFDAIRVTLAHRRATGTSQ
ncbi:MAG: RecQ family ATP-dependent DNA helicase [Pseudomonadota bacterium]|nr:RecQ family ATP-dependent DNA helicase [Pseudomonadota bacterium]